MNTNIRKKIITPNIKYNENINHSNNIKQLQKIASKLPPKVLSKQKLLI